MTYVSNASSLHMTASDFIARSMSCKLNPTLKGTKLSQQLLLGLHVLVEVMC